MSAHEQGHSQADDAQRRREVLDGLRREERSECGSRSAGIRDTDHILIARYRNPYIARRFRSALQSAGIAARLLPEGKRVRVEVKFADRERAWKLLEAQRAAYPDQVPPRRRGDYDLTILGGCVGLIAVFMTVTFTPLHVGLALAVLLGAVFVGYIADRCNRSYWYLGHLQFGLLDFLWATLSVALIVSLLRLVSRYL